MIIDFIPEAFESRIRLAIQTALLTGPKTFKDIKEVTKSTDGNLSSHLTKLEKLGYLVSKKEFFGKRPRTTYTLTEKGRASLYEYVNLLESILKQSEE